MILTNDELREIVVGGLIGDEQFQPTGIDLTLTTVDLLTGRGVLDFTNEKRILPMSKRLDFDKDGRIFLERGTYRVQVGPILRIPMDCVGFAFPRSSLTRMGCSIQGGLWDPGYEGDAVFSLVVYNEGGVALYKNARIAQIVLSKTTMPLPEGHGYAGVYQYHGLDTHRI